MLYVSTSARLMSLVLSLMMIASAEVQAQSFFDGAKTLKGFQGVIRKNLTQAAQGVAAFEAASYGAQFESQSVAFVPLIHIHPGQVRYSYNNVVDKLTKEGEKFAIFPPPGQSGDPILNPENDKGHSFYPESEALNVVLSDFGLILLDGHHGVITAIYFGASTLPVRIVADYRGKGSSQLWAELEAKAWAHLQTLSRGRQVPPSSFSDLEDDILRYFVALVAYKVIVDPSGAIEYSAPKSPPIWIKINNSVPFIEFILADILTQGGLQVNQDIISQKPMDPKIVERARALLLEAQKNTPLIQAIDLFADDIQAQSVIEQVKAVPNSPALAAAKNVSEFLELSNKVR
jgi:hypothetical protein